MRVRHTAHPPGTTAALRTVNQQRVLDVLRGGPGAVSLGHPVGGQDTYTQAELARATGLAPATVSGIVRSLVKIGLVESEAGSGRRGSSVRLSRGAGTVAGIDFGHSHIAVALADLTGRILREERRDLTHQPDHEEGLGIAATMLKQLQEDAGQGAALRQIGMGVPTPVTEGAVLSTAIFPGWDGIDVSAAAREAFGAPVAMENDANLGALAEHRRGVAAGQEHAVFVKISSGIGAGIVIGGQLFRGAMGTAGEIGHLTLNDQGPLCRCGSRGCLEAYSSGATVLAMIGDQLPEAGIDDVIAAAQDGNVAAQRALEDAGLHLGWGLASIVNLLNPGIVVVGGDMARAGELVLDSVRVGLRRHALDAAALTPVLAGRLDERASLVGAVLLAAEQIELMEHA